MENKFLNYIQDNNDNLKKSDLNEHEKNNSEKLIFLLKNSIEINQENCIHDLEELCLYVEGKSLKNELIKNQILECDSCFETYSLLKSQVEEIKNITPPYFKEKVYENKEAIIVKKSFWYILKDNKILKYSSGAIAACLLLFFTLNPFNADMSDFHEPKYRDKYNEVSKETSNDLKNIDIPKSSQTNSASVSIPKSKPNIVNKKTDNIKNNTNSLENKSTKIDSDLKDNKEDALKLRSVINNKKSFKPQELERQEVIKNDNNSNTKTQKKIKISKFDNTNKQKSINNEIKQKTEQNVVSPSSSFIKKKIPLKSVNSFKVPLSENSPSTRISSDYEINDTLEESNKLKKDSESKIIISPAEPVSPSNKTSEKETDKQEDKAKEESPLASNILNTNKPTISEIKDDSDKKVARVAPKAIDNIKKSLSINFTTNNNVFIIIKDNLGNIVYKSALIKKGKYNNFTIDLSNSSQYSRYFYIDSNNNNIFDEFDTLDKEIKINEN